MNLYLSLHCLFFSSSYCGQQHIELWEIEDHFWTPGETPHATNNHYYTYTCLIFWDPLATKGRDGIAVCFLMSFTHMFIWVLLSQLYCQSAPGSEVRGLVNGSCSSCR